MPEYTGAAYLEAFGAPLSTQRLRPDHQHRIKHSLIFPLREESRLGVR